VILVKVSTNLQKKSKENPKTLAAAATSHTANHVYYFGSFCLNRAEQQLLRNGARVRLAPKAFELLLVLIQNKGRLLTKDQLLAEVWPNVFVEEANLSVNIASLRKALDEGDAERHWIETVPKRGYRFVAPVCVAASQTNGENTVESFNSLAVLPFENEGCGPAGDYLSAGLMESITNSLSQSRDLRVMARHTVRSHHRYNIDPRAVGYELGVRSVLVGRILQFDDRMIVRTELVDVMNGWQLWGEQYHTKIADVLIVQQELTAEICERLRNRFSGLQDWA
jgi:DNA-binding winged helix-turn-helix (wHTH) protein